MAGLLALTVVAGVEQGLLATAQAAEANEMVTASANQEESVEQSEEQTEEQPQEQLQKQSSLETAKTAVTKTAVTKTDTTLEEISVSAKDGKNKKTEKAKKSTAPLTIEGDELYFDDHTGEVHAKGKVVVTQNPDTLQTEEMRGNTKTTEVWIDGVATIIQPEVRTTLTGHTVHYNYGTKNGEMAEPHGMVGMERVAGKDAQFYPDRLVAHEATMTRCPAKVPDYHVSATKVEIWPGDKLIAYNAKVWIKDTVIYSIGKYQRSLKDSDKSELPKVNYSNKDGVSLEQYFEYPLTNNWAFGTTQVYYTKQGYRPQYALIDREEQYTFRIDEGHFRDGNSNWIKKEPEFRFDWHSQRIGKLPIRYTFSAVYGKWMDSTKSSWHQDYTIYFTHDPIKLSDSLTWYIGTGWEKIKESYDGSVVNTYRANTSLYKVVSPKLTVWAGYNYTQNNKSLFDYGRADVGKELISGFSYKLDRMNTISFKKSYDLENERTYSDTISWLRNLHCWNMTLNYEMKRVDHTRHITWDIQVARW